MAGACVGAELWRPVPVELRLSEVGRRLDLDQMTWQCRDGATLKVRGEWGQDMQTKLNSSRKFKVVAESGIAVLRLWGIPWAKQSPFCIVHFQPTGQSPQTWLPLSFTSFFFKFTNSYVRGSLYF